MKGQRLKNSFFFILFSCLFVDESLAQELVPVIRPSAKLTRRAALIKKKKLEKHEQIELSQIHALLFPGSYNRVEEQTELSSTPKATSAMRSSTDALQWPDLPKLPSGPVDLDQETDPLFKEILGKVGPIYQQEGELALGKLFGFNADFDLGTSNFSGFEWQKPMGGFTVYVDRALAPDAFADDSWVITDTAVLVVSAQSFLKLLSDNELVEPLSDSQLGAYAGLSFSRTYTFQHMAESFDDGLKSPFEYLFFPFLYTRADRLAELPRPSYLKRIDSFVVSAGAVIYSPIYYGLSAKAGALFEFNHLSQLTFEASEFEPGVKIGLAKTNSLRAHAKAQLMADLYGILQLTLFAFDAQADWAQTQETSLMFDQASIIEFKNKSGEDYEELKQFLSGKNFELGTLSNNVLSHNNTITGGTSLDLEALFWGHNGSHQLSQIEHIQAESTQFLVKVVENKFDYFQKWWSKLLGDALKSVLGSSFLGANYFTFSKNSYALDYKRETKNVDPESLPEESLSLNFSQSYYLASSTGVFNKGPKKKFLARLTNFTGLDPSITAKIENDELVGPLTLSASLKIDRSGLVFFHQLGDADYTEQLVHFCQTRRPDFWLDEEKREQALGHLQIGKREICMKKMLKSYLVFQSEYERLGKQVGLKALRQWVDLAANYAKTPEAMLGFFNNGQSGALFAGTLQAAVGKKGPIYTTHFREGKVSTRGVINEELLLSGLPYPVTAP